MPHLAPDLTDEDFAAADAIIAGTQHGHAEPKQPEKGRRAGRLRRWTRRTA
jgi:hypothetical protein